MQADEFEEKIKNKLEEFKLAPDRAVWQQVSLKIEKAKRKQRVLIFWLFSGFVLLAGTAMHWFINNEKPVINEITYNSGIAENYKEKQKTPNSAPHLIKIQKTQIAKNMHLKRDDIKHIFGSERKTNDLSKNIYTKVINKKPVPIAEKKYGGVYKEEEKDVQKNLPPHIFYKPELAATAKTDTAVENNATDGKTNIKKDTVADRIAKGTIQTKGQTGKKSVFGFTIYSGISDNLSSLLSIKKNYVPSDFNSSGPSTIPGNYVSDTSLSNSFKSAFSFGLGIFIKKPLTKKISLSAGVDYHLYTVKSIVGKSVTATTTFYDPAFQALTSSARYFTVGNSVNYSNKYQLLELPVNVALQLNKNQKRPLLISAGISPGYLVSSNALYANQSANVYYVDKEKFNHFMLSAHSSFLFPVSNSHKYFLSAGPVVQYGFTNVAKTSDGSTQHLFFTGIKANITFK